MKLVALLSGGIDSPVAACLMAKRGAELVLLHMDNRPFSGELGVRKAVLLAEALRRETGQEMPLYMAPHGENQAINKERCQSSYQCVLCKRLMLRTAQAVARKVGASGIVMGDSLGQVASQTLNNIRAEQHGLELPVLRPLIGLDKLEIERLAKEMGTYEISIMSDGGKDCTAVPSRVITNASVKDILDEEAKVDLGAMAIRSAEMARRI
ncbi:MAG: thiamine biosynthesis protein ThiI [Methanomassiliicoccales archaeon PtaB.Bin215]|nr:MAG: thiamine biosynthesis protein ThiI [Methanomassiliicoccales archaeon PtaB.Bin215]